MPSDAVPKVAVIGLGYIGLPTAAVVARSGARVRGVDVSQHVVETVSAGRVHIEENDLDALVREVVLSGALTASLDMPTADFFVIAVPTPFKEGFAPDLAYVEAAARAVAPMLQSGNTVILESTSPVGTTETIRDILAALRPDLSFPHAGGDSADIAIAYCPERVLPGRILNELVTNDRCIGGISNHCAARARRFYERFVKGDCLLTSARTAEMVKLVENAFRDVNIAFANELSMISHGLDLDVWEVIGLANRHPRVNILQPGPGVGGHCIAVDPWFIVHSDPKNARLIRTAREVNDDKIDFTLARVTELIDDQSAAPIAVLGLAFKPNIDDLRSSPALEVALRIAQRYGDRVRIVEPYVDALPPAFDGSGAKLATLDDALDGCGSLVLLVDHDVFKAIPRARLEGLAVHDSRGIWSR